MSETSTHEVLRRRTNIGLIVAFFLILWLPAGDSFFKMDRAASINENRAPASFPIYRRGRKAVQNYLSGLEAYFNDHFGFRKRLVRWEKHWRKQIFRIVKSSTAVVGKDEWMYFTGGLMIDDIMGNKPFSDRELEAWRELLTQRRDWLAARGIRYLLVIPPDKHTIYPEFLPDWLAQNSRPPHRIDQFMNYMSTHTDVPILDLRPAILEGKKLGRIYHQTDTHWNAMGAFLGYRSLVEKLDSLGINKKPRDSSEFEVYKSNTAAGDLARMLGQEGNVIEKDAFFLKAKPPLATVESRVDSELLVKKWLPGTEPRVSENPGSTGRLLFFRDSFASYLMPYLGQDFKRIVYLWQHNWDKGFIEREKPDVVIDEMLERFLIYRDPATLRAAEETPDVQLFGSP